MAEAVDVTVVGAGPAGIAAAARAAEEGLAVRLLDEQPAPGGQVWRAADRVPAEAGERDVLRSSYAAAGPALAALRATSMRHHQGATLVDVSPDLELSWLQRREDGTHGVETATTRTLVLATGAMERPVPFAGWTLPGVMGVGALQTALKTGGLVPAGDGLVLAGQGPLLLLYLAQLEAVGARPRAVLDIGAATAPLGALPSAPAAWAGAPHLMIRGLRLLAARALARTPGYRVTSLEACGDGRLEAVRFTHGRRVRELPCAVLGVHDGVVPDTQPSRLLGLAHRWNPLRVCFEPVTDATGRSSDARVWVVGDAGGVEGAETATARGALAAVTIAAELGRLTGPNAVMAPKPYALRRRRGQAARRFLDRLYAPTLGAEAPADATVVCRCEAVTAGEIRAAVRDGASGPNRVKTFTRCGMGPCQGRLCGLALTRLVAAETGRPPDEVGALRVRPPLKPILLGDVVGSETAA